MGARLGWRGGVADQPSCCICGLDCRSEWCTDRTCYGCPAGRRAGGWGSGDVVRAGNVCARPVAGRIAGVMAAVALLVSAVGFSAPPAAAGLTSGDSIPEVTVLQANCHRPAGDDPNDPGMPVLTVAVTLQAGQTRLISDQLTVTVNRDDAEVENFVECIDPAGDLNAGVNAGGQPEAFSAGTNYSRGRGQLAMHGSLLFTAPHTGTFWCQVRAHTDAGTRLQVPPDGRGRPAARRDMARDRQLHRRRAAVVADQYLPRTAGPTRALPTPTACSWAGPWARTAIRSPRPCTAGRPLLWTPRLCT